MSKSMASKKPVVGIIQARSNSVRLETKMLQPLKGLPIIDWVITRATRSLMLDEIMITLPIQDRGSLLHKTIAKYNLSINFGEENDLVQRYLQCLDGHNAYSMVRVCADNPLICPLSIDKLIDFYKRNNTDYAFNNMPVKQQYRNKYPDGLGAEICSKDVVEWTKKNAKTKLQKEHFFQSLFEIRNDFKISTFNPSPELFYPSLRLDVDVYEDLMFLEKFNMSPDMQTTEIFERNAELVSHWRSN